VSAAAAVAGMMAGGSPASASNLHVGLGRLDCWLLRELDSLNPWQ
jgi:hypothetical protein